MFSSFFVSAWNSMVSDAPEEASVGAGLGGLSLLSIFSLIPSRI